MNPINMSLSYHKAHLLIIGIILLFACEKDKVEPTYTDGVLKGTTFYYEMNIPPYTTSPLSNVKVRATGPYGSKTALTNANGQYEIKNIGNGTYEIEFIKEGWGAVKYYSVQIYGNEVLYYNARMWKYPEFDMPVLETDNSKGWVIFRSNLPPGTTEIPNLRAFFGKTKDVSCYKYYYTDYVLDYTGPNFIYYDFRSMPEPRDETVYVVFYLIDPADNGEYDPYLAVKVFPSINPQKHSQVFKYDIP